MKKPIYLLYSGKMIDGNARQCFDGYTTKKSVAREYFRCSQKVENSFWKVEKITDDKKSIILFEEDI